MTPGLAVVPGVVATKNKTIVIAPSIIDVVVIVKEVINARSNC